MEQRIKPRKQYYYQHVHERGFEKKFSKKPGKRKRKREAQSRKNMQEIAKETVGEASRELDRRVLEVLPKWVDVDGTLDILIGIEDPEEQSSSDKIMKRAREEKTWIRNQKINNINFIRCEKNK